ncbi:MAG: hypothetical protein R2911_04110 [Caldilineaceae bacterium]
MNLCAAHLALDAHQELGNNAELAQRLDLNVIDWWAKSNKLGCISRSARRNYAG